MSDNIILHPERGLDPHLCFCPRCHGDSNSITLGYVMVAEDDHGRIMGYFEQGKRPKELQGYNTRDLKEGERVPGDLCDGCKQEIKEFKQIVAEGGLYWQCEECCQEGVIRDNDFTRHVRQCNNTPAPAPLGVKFQTCAEHGGAHEQAPAENSQ